MNEGEPFGLALTFEESDPRSLDAFEIESAMPWLVRIAVGGTPVLWGRARNYQSIWLLRGASRESPRILPPIRARQAREAAERDRWLELFAQLLVEGARFPGPRGRWQLTPLAPQGSLRKYLSLDPDGLPAPAYALDQALERPAIFEESWGVNGSCIVLPLREASEPEHARVKTWRKHAREGTLPPVLILHVAALDVHVVLDGHDRLRAALLEGRAPGLVALWRPRAEAVDIDPRYSGLRAHRAEAVARWEKASADRDRWRGGTVDRLNRQLVAAFRAAYWRADTPARARASSRERWVREVRARLAELGHGTHAVLDLDGGAALKRACGTPADAPSARAHRNRARDAKDPRGTRRAAEQVERSSREACAEDELGERAERANTPRAPLASRSARRPPPREPTFATRRTLRVYQR